MGLYCSSVVLGSLKFRSELCSWGGGGFGLGVPPPAPNWPDPVSGCSHLSASRQWESTLSCVILSSAAINPW